MNTAYLKEPSQILTVPTLQQLFAHLFDKIDFYVFLAVFHKQRLVGDQNEIKLNKLKCASKKLLKDDTTIDIPLFNTRLTSALITH